MQRPIALAAVLLATAALAPACAQGEETSSNDTSPTAPTDGGGCASGCPSGAVCSGGACVPGTTDADHDGFPAANDCNDLDPAVHPGAVEVCNGRDDDCNGKTDETFDADGDGVPTCAVLGKPADCDDQDPAVHPGAAEVCNGKDDDCDGKVDEDFDKDNDGFTSCARGNVPADCDDTDPNVRPGGVEVCNGKDDDCDGKTDELPATLTGQLSPPINTHWAFAGGASAANGWAQLTQDVGGTAGALWWSASYVFDTFDVSATIWIQAKAPQAGADGVGFAWVPGTNVTVAGAAGEGFGIYGLGGYGVVIDTYQNTGQPAAPFLTVFDGTTGSQLARAALPEVRDGKNHAFRVKLDGGKVSAWLDGISYLNDFAIPGYTPFTGHWGFTAGTGGSSSAHWVQGITMSFPNGQGCVP